MNKKLFWWGPTDQFGYAILWYIDSNNIPQQENLPESGYNSITNLLEENYVEISWQTARASGLPI